MFKIKTIAPEEATGAVAEIYGRFPAELGVPLAFRLLSASPDLLERQLGQMAFWKGRERFGEAMLASIRYLLASRLDLAGCRAMNATLLKLGGLDEAQIAALDGDPTGWPLSPERRALTAFAVDSVVERRPAAAAELDRLRDLGWSDQEIFEAVAFAGMVLGVTTAITIFKK